MENNKSLFVLHLYKNFGDYDDFKELKVERCHVGEVLIREEKTNWYLDKDEYSTSELIEILALKQEEQINLITKSFKLWRDEIEDYLREPHF